MKKVLLAVGLVLLAAASLVMWGSKFATGTVREQLAAQKITFPDKASLEQDNPALAKYASQKVDNGDEAKAYAAYIEGHLKNIANGQTYSEVSSQYQKDRTNQELAGQRTSLFMGETLRGLLLNAWGWGLIGTIAKYASLALFAAGGAALVAAAVMKPTAKKRAKK
jgi:hypothetical protein